MLSVLIHWGSPGHSHFGVRGNAVPEQFKAKTSLNKNGRFSELYLVLMLGTTVL